ncbi:preprotein translocase subunit SecD [Methylobacterium sp. Leaf399]|uniref:protein translocase subunit SecD n=1 Tax=unclassified Methylobacterium TaxID=2615210 RepID=UPI0006FBEC5C|nr:MULTISPECIES: protein translocase subunit SecD [unclassified Methylobacterium]KQP48819.1 preprotein translocase subunit SecD [Methylobacterium sp. Leaf108]KQT15151.1 preprotein translocase subunit SecD [Methylobacterium sp. Leaf399]KQT83005.1 preprotein translocase subunit SecD [Methylobacterium sp. Leaf466]
MLRFSRTKIVTTLAIILIGLSLAVPSFFSPEQRKGFMASLPSWFPSWIVPTRAIVLGLDLQGGSQLLLEVDQNDLISSQAKGLRDDVRRILQTESVRAEGGIQLLPRGVQVRISDAAARAKVMPKLQELSLPISNPLVGQSGGRTVDVTEQPDGLIRLVLTDAGIGDRTRRAVSQGIEVIRRRIDSTGTLEPSIQQQGADRILVQVPGEQDPQRLETLVGKTAKLEFRMLSDSPSGDVDLLPSRDEKGARVPVERRIMAEGGDLTDAQPAFDQQTQEPMVSFKFNLKGAQRFGQATSENVGRRMAIVLDNEVVSAPRINTPITGGSGQITGNFTVKDANELSVLLRAGALPAKFTAVERRVVGPGLGKDSIEAGKWATLAAGVLVIAFMFATYGVFGFFANIALIVHVGLILGLMSVLEATMTLPGIAGIVLTIGTAVDSNVLIYERVREEVRAGRSIVSALQAGFDKAFATIIDSNSTMAIAAVILFFLGSGPVKGFAVVFILGILTTVITAVTLTRMMIALWYNYARPKALPF